MHRKLSFKQRQTIEHLLEKGQSQAAIARTVGVHRSTVKRELERNSQQGIYNAFHAHCAGVARKVMAGKLTAMKKRILRRHGIKSPQPARIIRWLSRINNGYTPPGTGDDPRNRRDRLSPSHRFKMDLRKEQEHPHGKRSISYWSWKRYWEQNYRLREHWLEALKRSPRTALDWRNYRYQKSRGIFAHIFGRCWQISQNKAWRQGYESRLQKRRIEEYKILIAQNHRRSTQKEKSPPPFLFAPWFIFFPLHPVRRSTGLLCALPPPAG